jgi:hypothetical protein
MEYAQWLGEALAHAVYTLRARKHQFNKRHFEMLHGLLADAHAHAGNEDGSAMGASLHGFYRCLKAQVCELEERPNVEGRD